MQWSTIKWNVKDQGYAINHDQVKCQRSRISNEPKLNEISKDRGMQLTKINGNINGHGCAMNHNQVKCQRSGTCNIPQWSEISKIKDIQWTTISRQEKIKPVYKN